MKKIFLIVVLFMLSFSVWAQSQGYAIDAQLALQKAQSGAVQINGLAQNKGDKAVALSYSMRLRKTGPAGQAINTQSGSFTLTPGEEKILASLALNLVQTDSFEIILKIFDDEQIVAQQRMQKDQHFQNAWTKLSSPTPSKQTSPQTAMPKVAPKTSPVNTDVLEIEGLIIDETRSKTGRDFYDIFYTKWNAPPGAKDFTIVIRELPARGLGARVSVEVNGNTILSRFLQPRLDIIELTAEQCAQIIQKHLSDRQTLQKDLESGDVQGSGIY